MLVSCGEPSQVPQIFSGYKATELVKKTAIRTGKFSAAGGSL